MPESSKNDNPKCDPPDEGLAYDLRIPTVAESLAVSEDIASLSPRANDSWLRRQEAVVAIGRRAITPPTFSILMQDSAALIAEMLGVEYSATAEFRDDRESLQMKLTLGHPDEPDVRTLTRQLGIDKSESLAGYSLQVAHPVAVEDLERESRFRDRFLVKCGLRGAIAVPLITQERAYGVLCAGSPQEQRFGKEDLLFVETVAHVVTTTIARGHTEQVLADQRQLTDGMLQTMDALVLILDGLGRVVHVNRACTRATGFTTEDIKDRPIWTVFPVPSEAEQFRTAFRELRHGDRIEYESSLLTKHAEQRRIAWSCAIVREASGDIESIVVTGIDVTEQRDAEARAQKAEEEATEAKSVQHKVIEALTLDAIPDSLDEDLPLTEEQRAVALKRLEMLKAAAAPKERRGRPRRSYPYHQLVAPLINDRLPARHEFIRVSCNDIASGGFSFLASEPPPSDLLVVALGTPPHLTHVVAEVVHVTRIKRKGKTTFLVGCSYTGRVDY